MAGSKSRGAIEEGTATFSNESEKIINFQTSAQTQKFPFPPSVKVISIDGTGQGAGNANIHVSFTNVTINGMTILTSAPFTGTIRYLCSTNG
jgi:hypothetical protein